MLAYPGMADRTLILDGFSKSFAMTGWRLGYTVAPARIVPALAMLAINSYTCVAEFSQYAAIEALHDRDGATPRMVNEFGKRRQQFIRDLNSIPGFRCQAPEGAFYAWVNIADTGMTAEELCRILLEESGVAAIPWRSPLAPPAATSSASPSPPPPQTCRKQLREFYEPHRPGESRCGAGALARVRIAISACGGVRYLSKPRSGERVKPTAKPWARSKERSSPGGAKEQPDAFSICARNTGESMPKPAKSKRKPARKKPQHRHIPWKSVEIEDLNPLLKRHFIVGQNVMLARVLLKKGCIVPEHSHHNEQVTYILDGALKFWIGGQDQSSAPRGSDHPARPAPQGRSSRRHRRPRCLQPPTRRLDQQNRPIPARYEIARVASS